MTRRRRARRRAGTRRDAAGEKSARPRWPAVPPGVRLALLAAICATIAIGLFWRTLHLFWAYDDIDYINHTAEYLSGQWSLAKLLLRPQGEHLVPLFRLLLLASLKLVGIAATPFRVATLLVHAGTATLLGALAYRYSRSDAAAAATALAYVVPCGFSTMWLWFPSGSCVPWAICAYVGAMTLLSYRERLGARRARVLAYLAILVALGFETTHAPMAAGPMLIDELERRRSSNRRGWIGAFSWLVAATVVATSLVAMTAYTRVFGPRMSISLTHGLPRALDMLLLAPFRYFFPSTAPNTVLPLRWAVAAALLGAAVLVALAVSAVLLWRRRFPETTAVAALAAVGPVGVVTLCGLGRWRTSYPELDYAGRYLFTLLVPASLLLGALLGEVWDRSRGRTGLRAAIAVLLALFTVAFAARHRAAMLARIPTSVYDEHATRFAQLELLARGLEAAASSRAETDPLHFPNTSIWLDGVHNGRISAPILVGILVRDHRRIALGGKTIDAHDAEALNPVLESWARSIHEPLPYLQIVDGALRDAHFVNQVDFRKDAADGALVEGLGPIERGGRVMSARAAIRLRLTSPGLMFLVETGGPGTEDPKPTPMGLAIVDDRSGVAIDLPPLSVRRGAGRQLLRADATPFLARFGSGRLVRLVLTTPASSGDGGLRLLVAGNERPPD